MTSSDRLDYLQLFVRIAETGSLSEAGRVSGLSQPSASRQLKRLEDIVGTQLVARSTVGLSLTDAGQQFLAKARAILEDWDRAVDGSEAEDRELVGPIRVAVPIAIGQNLLAAITARFLIAHPKVTITWDLRDDAIDLASTGYDLWIRAGHIHQQDLIVRELWYIQRTVVAGPRHPLVQHPKDLAPLSAVRLSTFVPKTIEFTDAGGAVAVLDHRSVFTTDNLYAALSAVREGLGYAILPLWATQRQIEDGSLVRLCPAWRPPDVTLSLAYAPARHRSRRFDALLRYIKHELTRADGLGIAFLEKKRARPFVTQAVTAAEDGVR